jgi:hypothetical protein
LAVSLFFLSFFSFFLNLISNCWNQCFLFFLLISQKIFYFPIINIQSSFILLSSNLPPLLFVVSLSVPFQCPFTILLNFQFLHLSTSVKLPDHPPRNQVLLLYNLSGDRDKGSIFFLLFKYWFISHSNIGLLLNC